MKADQFKELIKKIVVEEVRKEVSNQLPKLLFEMVRQKPQQEQIKSVIPKEVVPKPTSPKTFKTYVKNPILNQVLNETTPGLPQTPYGEGVPLPSFDKVGNVSDEFKMEMRQILNEETPIPDQTVQEPSTPTPSVDVSKLFNKNFKAILDKSKNGHSGGFNSVLQNW